MFSNYRTYIEFYHPLYLFISKNLLRLFFFLLILLQSNLSIIDLFTTETSNIRVFSTVVGIIYIGILDIFQKPLLSEGNCQVHSILLWWGLTVYNLPLIWTALIWESIKDSLIWEDRYSLRDATYTFRVVRPIYYHSLCRTKNATMTNMHEQEICNICFVGMSDQWEWPWTWEFLHICIANHVYYILYTAG